MWIRSFAISLGITSVLLLYGHVVYAQNIRDDPRNIQTESITLSSGDILEIFPIIEHENEIDFSWILTLDRTFLYASQSKIFRKRLIQPGAYILNAEFRNLQTSTTRRITIAIFVDPRQKTTGIVLEEQDDGQNQNIVHSSPQTNSLETIVLPQNIRIVQLTPNPNVRGIIMDTDPYNDTNNDGENTNDNDAEETFFSREGSSLYILLTSDLTAKDIILHAMDETATQRTQMLKIANLETSKTQGLMTGDPYIEIKNGAEDHIEFSLIFEGDVKPNIPLLFEWDFGDGETSLLENPTHLYRENKTYTITLTVRNLQTGEDISKIYKHVSVSNIPVHIDESLKNPDISEVPPESQNEEHTDFARMTLIILGAFGSLVLLGTASVFILRKRRSKDIDSMKNAQEHDTDDTPVTIEIATQKTPHQSETRSHGRPQEPIVAQEPAPQWLTPEEEIEEKIIDKEAPIPPWLQPTPVVKETAKPETHDDPLAIVEVKSLENEEHEDKDKGEDPK